MKPLIIAVDFDGTIVEDRFPHIGNPKPHAFETLKKWQKVGIKLILWTCRQNMPERAFLDEAVNFCKTHGLEFDAVNDNIQGIGISPKPKIYADHYIDDRAILMPVDWKVINTCLFGQRFQPVYLN